MRVTKKKFFLSRLAKIFPGASKIILMVWTKFETEKILVCEKLFFSCVLISKRIKESEFSFCKFYLAEFSTRRVFFLQNFIWQNFFSLAEFSFCKILFGRIFYSQNILLEKFYLAEFSFCKILIRRIFYSQNFLLGKFYLAEFSTCGIFFL